LRDLETMHFTLRKQAQLVGLMLRDKKKCHRNSVTISQTLGLRHKTEHYRAFHWYKTS